MKAISIHAPREGGDEKRDRFLAAYQAISIHAPREGGDYVKGNPDYETKISIHAPREGGDEETLAKSQSYMEFQSTPPARGATKTCNKQE